MPVRSTSSRAFWEATATIPSGLEEKFSPILLDHFGPAVTSYTDFETGRTTVGIYLQKKDQWNPELIQKIAAIWERVRPSREMRFPTFQLKRVRPRDWAESWKRHFKVIRIGNTLQVCPPWVKIRVPRDCKVVVLEPGLSFGTGQHPTTAFCLNEIVRCRKFASSFLDAGTGSGILAIAAARLGFAQIEAFDFDPEAIRIARGNASRNSVARQIRFAVRNVAKLARTGTKFDLICANLIANVLVAHRDALLSRLSRNGTIVLAGILKTEFIAVQRHFEAAGLRLVRSKALKEWRSGSFMFQQLPRK